MRSETAARTRISHFLMVVDGFILTGALWLLLNVVPAAIMLPLGVEEPSSMGGVLQGSLWFLATVAPIIAGTIAAWVLHGHRMTWQAAGGMTAGIAAGFFAGFLILGGISQVVRFGYKTFLTEPVEGPPWALFVVLALAIATVLIVPFIDAVRDLRAPEHDHVRLDATRLTSIGIIILLAVVVAPWLGFAYGSEIAEAGAFLGPIAFAGAAGVAGADALLSLLGRNHALTAGA